MSSSPNTMGSDPKFPPHSTLSTQQSLVRVPPDLLRSLIAKVAQLERSQETSNSALRCEIAQLQANAGVAFSRFSKLPKELRDMIWDFALKTPQTHIMRGEYISRSKVNDVMQACSEARNRGLVLRLPYDKVGRASTRELRTSDPYEFLPTAPRFYMNFDVDTFWVGQHHRILPECIRCICGFCDLEIKSESIEQASFTLPEKAVPKCQHKISLKRLALRYDMLTYFRDRGVPTQSSRKQLELINLLRRMNPEELLLVVGRPECTRERNVRFVPPSQRPDLMIQERRTFDIWTHPQDEWEPILPDSWDLAAQVIESNMKIFKERIGETRKHLREVHGVEPNNWKYAPDLCEWEIPKVRFVETFSDDRDWIFSKRMR